MDNPEEKEFYLDELPVLSDWECELFGMGRSLVVTPQTGRVPNFFWRFMQYLVFGNKWRKITKNVL